MMRLFLSVCLAFLWTGNAFATAPREEDKDLLSGRRNLDTFLKDLDYDIEGKVGGAQERAYYYGKGKGSKSSKSKSSDPPECPLLTKPCNTMECHHQKERGRDPSLPVCTGVRGNGPRLFAHFPALARVVEAFGPIRGFAGTSVCLCELLNLILAFLMLVVSIP